MESENNNKRSPALTTSISFIVIFLKAMCISKSCFYSVRLWTLAEAFVTFVLVRQTCGLYGYVLVCTWHRLLKGEAVAVGNDGRMFEKCKGAWLLIEGVVPCYPSSAIQS